MKGFFITEEQYNKMVESYDKVAAELDQIKKLEKKECTPDKLEELNDLTERLVFLVDTLSVFVSGVSDNEVANGLYGLELTMRDIVKRMESIIVK